VHSVKLTLNGIFNPSSLQLASDGGAGTDLTFATNKTAPLLSQQTSPATEAGSAANSPLILGGGTITLNSALGGSAGDPLVVNLDMATNLMLSPMQFITAIGSNGNDTITAAAINQTLTGGGGTDTLIGYAGGYDTFQDTAAGLNGDTITNFVPTDQIDITNLIPGAATLTATPSGANTAVTVVSGGTATSFLMTGSFTRPGFTLAPDGAGGTVITHT